MQFSIHSILKAKNLLKQVALKWPKTWPMGLKWGVFGKIGYPGIQEGHMLAFIGYFKQQKWVIISGYLCFCKKKVTIFVFFEILVPNIFENILKSVVF